MRFLFGLLLLISGRYALLAQNPAPTDLDPKVWNEINNFANLQKDPARLNSPGAQFTMEETNRQSSAAGTLVFYSLRTKNLPKDQKYSLSILRVNRQIQQEDTTKILNKDGDVLDGPNDPHTLILMAAKGEPYVIVLASEDGKYKAATSVVPFPIETSDKSCQVGAMLLMTDAEGLLLRGKGFEANSAVKIALDSEGEKHEGPVQADKDGAFSFVVLPYKKDTKKGTVHIVANGSVCAPKLNVVWGKGTYHVE